MHFFTIAVDVGLFLAGLSVGWVTPQPQFAKDFWSWVGRRIGRAAK